MQEKYKKIIIIIISTLIVIGCLSLVLTRTSNKKTSSNQESKTKVTAVTKEKQPIIVNYTKEEYESLKNNGIKVLRNTPSIVGVETDKEIAQKIEDDLNNISTNIWKQLKLNADNYDGEELSSTYLASYLLRTNYLDKETLSIIAELKESYNNEDKVTTYYYVYSLNNGEKLSLSDISSSKKLLTTIKDECISYINENYNKDSLNKDWEDKISNIITNNWLISNDGLEIYIPFSKIGNSNDIIMLNINYEDINKYLKEEYQK